MNDEKCPLCGSYKFTIRSDGNFMDDDKTSNVIIRCAKPTCDFGILFKKS